MALNTSFLLLFPKFPNPNLKCFFLPPIAFSRKARKPLLIHWRCHFSWWRNVYNLTPKPNDCKASTTINLGYEIYKCLKSWKFSLSVWNNLVTMLSEWFCSYITLCVACIEWKNDCDRIRTRDARVQNRLALIAWPTMILVNYLKFWREKTLLCTGVSVCFASSLIVVS